MKRVVFLIGLAVVATAAAHAREQAEAAENEP
jgi:hypothetical protein